MAWISATAAERGARASALTPDQRIPFNNSNVIGSPEPVQYRTKKIFENLQLVQPIYLIAEPGTNNYFVIEHKGHWAGPGSIRRFSNEPCAAEAEILLEIDYLIYGMTCHPNYVENGYIYVTANGPVSAGQETFQRIIRYTVERTSPYKIDPKSELVIIQWETDGPGHNGGEPGFGPDGMLYCPTGDGTSGRDVYGTGQGVDDLLSVMLRIDVDHPDPARPYSIPKDNPFINYPGARPEIWAFGFRNPYRMTFDRKTGQLWVGQVGEGRWEQVYLVQRGENYGWSVQEGSHPFHFGRKAGPGPIIPPTIEHPNSEFRSLTGGVVYYGSELPELHGTYIYGDFVTGRIWGARHDGEKVTWQRELADTAFAIVGFAEGIDGELIVVDHKTGLHKLEPRPEEAWGPPFPTKLSETGLFTSVPDHQVHPGLIPYAVNSPLWSDGAHKQRFIALPGTSQIEFHGEKSWDLPEGAVLVKTFALDEQVGNPPSRRRVETRLMTKQQGEWVGYSYEWNAEQTEAVLVDRTGKDKTLVIMDPESPSGEREQVWHYPSRAECMMCHTRAANFLLGLQTAQMNRPHEYLDGVRNQLETLAQLGIFNLPQPALPQPADAYPTFANPYDDAEPLEARVRSYLHVNCSICHQPNGGVNSKIDLRHATSLDGMKVVSRAPIHDSLGVARARLIAPGAPHRSLLLERTSRRGRGQMPPLATALVDKQAVEMLTNWVKQLPPLGRARISVNNPMLPPNWALLQRELLRANVEACEEFFDRYFDERGWLLCVERWGGYDGPNDAIENLIHWPILHAAGASDSILHMYKKAWEGHLLQFTQAKTVEVPYARDGMYYKEFPVMMDWLHNAEGLTVFMLQGLSDPHDDRRRERLRRFAGFYMNEDPQAQNYDPQHRIIRSMFNGSRGPLLRKTTSLDWAGDPIEFKGRFRLRERGQTSYEQIVAHFKDYNDIVGDHPSNLLVTALPLKAYMLEHDQKYKDWVLEYVGAWRERMIENGYLIPSNIGLDGKIGSAADGKWYGGVYGWGFTVVNPVNGQLVDRQTMHLAIHGFTNAVLLTGDLSLLDPWRKQMDVVNSNQKIVDGKIVYPHKYGDNGWYSFNPGPYRVGATEIYYMTFNDDDLARVPNNPWFQYLSGKNPDYPEQVLRSDFSNIRARVAAMRADSTTPDTRLSNESLSMNPASVRSLTELTMGGLLPGRQGLVLHCRLRYFDPVKRRAGLPEGVAALIEKMTDDKVVVTLVNTNQIDSRTVVVQAGGYAEHQFVSVDYDGGHAGIDASHFTVELAPDSGSRLALRMERYVNQPTLTFPWDRY